MYNIQSTMRVAKVLPTSINKPVRDILFELLQNLGS